jgi:hypothetical protein
MLVSVHFDVDVPGCIADRKSTSGFEVLLGGNLVYWNAKKHKRLCFDPALNQNTKL